MAKSKILKELVNNKIMLEVALSRLLLIASDINDNELMKWAQAELSGYNNDDTLPNYRILGSGYITYSGINCICTVNNLPLPIESFEDSIREALSKNYVRESVSVVQNYAIESEKIMQRDLTFLAGEVYKRQRIKCTKISMAFDKNDFMQILSAIRTKLIEIFIKLEKEFGAKTIDDLDVDIQGKNIEDIKSSINNIIYNDNSVKIGDKNKIEESSFCSAEV